MYPHKMDIHKKKEDSYCKRLFEPGNQIIINEFLIYALKYYNSTHGSVRLLTTGSERSTMAKVKRLHLENLLITYAAPKLSLDFWAKLPTGLVIDDCERVLNLANQAGHQIMQVKI